MGELTHFDAAGGSRMVDVTAKPVTLRKATASGRVRMSRPTLALIRDRKLAKGDVLEVARLAGIMGAKRTAELIPLCHALPLDAVEIDFDLAGDDHVGICATTLATARTGVEMEALLAVSVAALTIYDMCKAVDRGMIIENVQLDEKLGGRSGHYTRLSPSMPSPPSP
jgi:cyclic pyranopterin phosphate synthase